MLHLNPSRLPDCRAQGLPLPLCARRMWRNTVVTRFVDWLRQHNAQIPQEQRYAQGAGFYGLDLYSLHESGTACSAKLCH